MAIAQPILGAELRLARYYARKLWQAKENYQNGGAGLTNALTTLDQEWAQIKQWQVWLTDCADNADCARLAIEFAANMIDIRQSFSDRLGWLQYGLDAARSLDDQRATAEVLIEISRVHTNLGDKAAATETAAQALAAAQQENAPILIMRALVQRGLAAVTSAEFEAAETYFQQAYTSGVLDDQAAFTITNQLALITYTVGNIPRAIEYLKENVRLSEKMGNIQQLITAKSNLGTLFSSIGNDAEAQQLALESYEIRKMLGDKRGMAGNLNLLGSLAQKLGTIAQAKAYMVEVVALTREIESPYGQGWALYDLSVDEMLLGNYDEAARYVNESLKMMEDSENYDLVQHQVASILLAQGAYAQAQALELRTLQTPEIAQELPAQAEIYRVLGICARELGEFEQALTYFQQALAIPNIGDVRPVEVYCGLAETHLRRGDDTAAQECIRLADEIEQKHQGFPIYQMADIRAVEVKLQLRAGQRQAAQQTLCAALRTVQQLEVVMPRLRVVEAGAELLAADGDIRCISLLSLLAHHPASMPTMGTAMEARYTALANTFDRDSSAAEWENGATLDLNTVLLALVNEFCL